MGAGTQGEEGLHSAPVHNSRDTQSPGWEEAWVSGEDCGSGRGHSFGKSTPCGTAFVASLPGRDGSDCVSAFKGFTNRRGWGAPHWRVVFKILFIFNLREREEKERKGEQGRRAGRETEREV